MGYQAVQSTHGAIDLIIKYPNEMRQWHDASNTLVMLSVPTEKDLYDTAKALKSNNIKYIEFKEPDIGYALTSLALLPSEEATVFCKGNFTTALRSYKIDAAKNALAETREKELRELTKKMECCLQTKTQNILQHGLSVRDYTFDLIGMLRGEEPKYEWRLPDWFRDNKDLLLKNLLSDYYIDKYTIFHDCGKPYCLTLDEQGKQHFLHHAETSYKIWAGIGGNEQIGKLIRMDMDIHTLTAEQVPEFAARKEAATLLLVGLAELHSNADMFGGINSISFKTKWKRLDRRGKAICDLIQRTEEVLDDNRTIGK